METQTVDHISISHGECFYVYYLIILYAMIAPTLLITTSCFQQEEIVQKDKEENKLLEEELRATLARLVDRNRTTKQVNFS